MSKYMMIIAAVLMLAGVGIVSQAHAEDGVSIAVVDMQALVGTSKAGQNIGKQLEAHREAILKELSSKESALLEEEKALIEARKGLSKEEFAKKVQAFEKDKLALQKLSIERRNALNVASIKAEKQLMDKIVEVVGVIAGDKSYDLVLTKQNVVVGTQSIDITEEALKRLNKAVSTIKVELKK